MKKIFLFALFVISQHYAYSQDNGKNQILDNFLQTGMKDWNIPGMSVVVVQKGKVVFQKSYGVKDLRTKAPVNDQTLFGMASTTKAVVAIALGMLVDKGVIKWTDKVVQHLPQFKLNDPYITAEARVVDLLTHNLGIRNTDKIWVWDSLSNTDAMERYSHAMPEYSLRGGFSYQNMMYIIAGELISQKSGMDWTSFIQKNIFNPLGMKYSASTAAAIVKHANNVTPHERDYEEGLVPIPLNFTQQVGAAGALWSCIEDMGKYISFLINRGMVNGDTLLKPATFDFLFKPQVISSSNYAAYKIIKPNFNTYSLGWYQHDYRGEKIDFHTGSLAGLNALAGLLHEKQTGVYFFANSGSANFRHAVLYKVMDLYAFNDEKGRDWNKELFDMYSASDEKDIAKQEKQNESRIKDAPANFELKKYVGVYTHKMFGKLTVTLQNNQLKFNFNNYTFFNLEHWHYNTFRSSKHPEWRYRTFLNFPLNRDGEIEKVEFNDPYIELEFVKE